MRDITSGFETEIEASQLAPIAMLQLEFDSGTIRMWSGIGDLTYDSNIFYGVGNLLAIESAEETNELKATSGRFRLSGVDSSMLSLSLLENYQGRPASYWFGVLDTVTRALIPDPYLVFKGKMDILEISDNGETSEVTLSAESDLIDLRVVRERKYTNEDQKSMFPTDEGLSFVANIQDISINWGVGVT